jgi:heterodisulfide reductase subunit A
MIPLMRQKVPVEATTSFIDEQLCAGCGQCAQVCTFSALSLHPVRHVMTVNAVLCQGCGACAATCPSGAINVHHFTFDQFIRQIEALSEWHFEALPLMETESN